MCHFQARPIEASGMILVAFVTRLPAGVSMSRVTLEATWKVVEALLAWVTEQWGDAEYPSSPTATN